MFKFTNIDEWEEGSYGGVHNADAVRTDGIGYVTNVRRAKEFVVARPFDKHLGVDIVIMLRNETVQITKDIQDITALERWDENDKTDPQTRRRTCSSVLLGRWGSCRSRPYFCEARLRISE